jgi:hypothetical protein
MNTLYRNYCPKCQRKLSLDEVVIRGYLPVCAVHLIPLVIRKEGVEKNVGRD